MHGRFITFEGGEGAGKSTQVARLAARLRDVSPTREVVVTREPGGSPGAERLRDLLVRGSAERWSPLSETLMLFAARADHLDRVIRPALRRGAWVVCDRFADSTRAYQGAGGGVDATLIGALEKVVVDGDRPDLTLILDLPVAIGLARARARGGEDARFEAKEAAFHERLRRAFLEIAAAEPPRCLILDAQMSADALEATIWRAVSARLLAAAP